MDVKATLASIPAQPGCYLFKDSKGVVLYVGKAKHLKKRASSYFQKKDHDPKTQLLVSKIAEVDFIVTGSEVEALVLENNLIKKYYPRYNIDLKDSRRYAYLKFNEDYGLAWLEVVRKREGKGPFYGPFVSGTIRKHVLDVLRRNFRILMRKPSPRVRKIVEIEDYKERVKQAKLILSGKVDAVIKQLRTKMQTSSDKGFYEHAMTMRNQIRALEFLAERQHMEMKREVDAHVMNYVVAGNKLYLLVFVVRKGILEGKQRFSFDARDGIFEEFLSQYYTTTAVPKEIILPEKVSPALKAYLSELRGSKVSVLVPAQGERKSLLDLVLANVHATFFPGKESLDMLQKSLDLAKYPRVIECFDISHLGGTQTVASMVRFVDGLADKSSYRRFRVREETFGDDFAAMKEVVARRYGKSLARSMSLPDLVVIDGGLGQLGVAQLALKEVGVKLPIISLAKRLEEIYVPGKNKPIQLAEQNKGLLLLRAIRDEAHRFAISYQRLLRSKKIREE